MKIAGRKIVRDIDDITINKYGIPGLVLMENAGRAVSNVILNNHPQINNISIFCGGGNNGGDGFVIARHLISAGKDVSTYILKSPADYKGDAKTNLESLRKISKNIKKINSSFSNYNKSDLIVDAIFGTGLVREVKGPADKIIEKINSLRTPKISVDIPSGLDADSGRPLGIAVKASATVTFIVPKTGLIIYPGVEYTGKLFIADITTPKKLEENIKTELITFGTCKKMLKGRSGDTHKGTYGHTLIIAGSTGKTGAASLCAHSAVRSGSGLVTIGAPKSIIKSIEEKIVEPMSEGLHDSGRGYLNSESLDDAVRILETKTSLAIGPGISTNKGTEQFLVGLLKKIRVPVVVDADAINIIANNKNILKKLKIPVILTPHPGEMARLAGTNTKEIQENRISHASDFAAEYKCFIVLKGARSIVATPEGQIYVNPTGNPGMSTGGMGDVLAGVIAGLISQQYNPGEACILGTFSHGLSGDIVSKEIGRSGITATDVANSIPAALKEINLIGKEPFFEIIR